ncbi:unnamed protein product, partial [Mesorhabditis belari]|uniref:Neurotransmitter-gated ion-channel ligand-binding domain-containing protein n=1 Tax=Mesorhabditis belari TaxID=2138241 RepID=A0AAF3F8K7_9BILA
MITEISLLFTIFRVGVTADLLDEFRLTDSYKTYFDVTSRLFNDKFVNGGYRKEISPIFTIKALNVTDPVPRFPVQITFIYFRLVQLDAQAQLMTALVEFSYKWPDLRLQWNPAEYSGLDTIWLKYDTVWFPENVISDTQEFIIINPEVQRTVRLSSNGTVAYYFSGNTRASCQMNVRVFPFDTQKCEIGFSVETYGSDFVTATGETASHLDDSIYDGNGEWEVLDIKPSKKIYSSYNAKEQEYEYIKFTLHLKRRPHFYIYVIVLPCFMLTLLSIVGMFWNAHIKEEKLTKLSIGLTSMMSMTLLLDMMAQEIPKNATFPLLGFYVIISIGIIALGCAVVVIVSSPQPRSREKFWSEKVRRYLCSRTFVLQFFFQLMNIINFIVLFSFWR